ncbi:MAG: Crp/Fnr family transcriptional regulator [Kiloniellales bacterium]
MRTARPLEKRAILEGHFLLHHLPAETLENLSRYVRLQKFAKGDVIVQKGAAGSGMMAVVEGRVKISTVSPDGKEIILDFINPGEVFGEIALLDKRERTADAIAMEACRVLVLERREFLPFLERHPKTCIKLLSVLCGRLRHTNQLIEDSLFLNVESRLAKRLLGFTRQYGEPRPDGILVRLKLSQREIAALIGVTRESINKQLSAWQERGWVKVSRGSILVTDIEALESVVDIYL